MQWPRSSHAMRVILLSLLNRRLWSCPLSWLQPCPLGISESTLLSHGGFRAPLALRWPHSSHAALVTLLSCSDGCVPLATRSASTVLPPSVGIPHALWGLMTALSSRMEGAAHLSHCGSRAPLVLREPHSFRVALAMFLTFSNGHTPLAQRWQPSSRTSLS